MYITKIIAVLIVQMAVKMRPHWQRKCHSFNFDLFISCEFILSIQVCFVFWCRVCWQLWSITWQI